MRRPPWFRKDDSRTLWYGERIYVPDIREIQKLILKEAHETIYSIHPDGEKIYQDIKKRFWWYRNEEREIAEYVAVYDVCQKDQGRTPKAHRIATTPKWPRVEVVRDWHGLHSGLTQNIEGLWLDLGHSRLANKCCPFYTVKTTYTVAKLAKTIWKGQFA